MKAIDDYKIRQAIKEYRIEQELGQQPSIETSFGKTHKALTVTAEPVEPI
jgi:hypothetical protein